MTVHTPDIFMGVQMNIYKQIEKMDEMQLRIVVERMAEMLGTEAKQLDRWAFEAQTGGWSTQQFAPMKTRASNIRKEMLGLGIEV